ncbi:MAG: phosphonate C-P lyase system protein PhnG [Pseudomonadota bacterium]
MKTESKTNSQRQDWMKVLALSNARELLGHWCDLELDPDCTLLRGPETGLIALRGRMGGGGAPFNFGEATVTRATVRLDETGAVGHAVMLGRNQTKAKLAAILDALAQDETQRDRIEKLVIAPLKAKQAARDEVRAQETAATKVDFFTLVRGDD